MKTIIRYILFLLLAVVSADSSAQGIDSTVVDSLKKKGPFMLAGVKQHRMTLTLDAIYVQDEIFFFHFSLRNRSRLSYPVDLIRLFIRDESKAARVSIQEMDLFPWYADSLTNIAAGASVSFVLAVPKFTIPQSRILVLEIFELSGGRNLRMSIGNRQLFLARPVISDTLSNSLLHPYYEKLFNRIRRHRAVR